VPFKALVVKRKGLSSKIKQEYILRAIGSKAFQVDCYNFWCFIKQKTSLSFCVVMTGLTEIFILTHNPLNRCKLRYGPLESFQIRLGIWRN